MIWNPFACTSPASNNLIAPIDSAKSAVVLIATGWVNTERSNVGSCNGGDENCFALKARHSDFFAAQEASHARLPSDSRNSRPARVIYQPVNGFTNVAEYPNRVIIVMEIICIGVDVDDRVDLWEPDAGAVCLAYPARSNDDGKVGLGHRPIAGDRTFRSANVQILRDDRPA